MARGGRRTYTRDANGRFASSSGGGGSLASARKASSPKSARKPPSASKAKPSTGKAKPAAKSASNGAPSRAERNRIMGETQKKAQAAYNAAKAKGKGKRAQEAVYRRVIDQGLVKVGLKKPSLGTRIAKGISRALPSTGKAKPAAKSASNGAPSRAERNRIMGETQKKAQAAYNAAKAKGKGKRAQEAVYRRVIDQGLVKVGLKKPSLGTRIAKGISRALGR